jgi:hypothetical protein
VGKGPRPYILMLWTPAAETWLASQGRSIAAEIGLIQSTMKSAMQQSNWFAVYPQFPLAQQIAYTEVGPTLEPDLRAITGNTAPVTPTIDQLRTSNAADLVMLIGHFPQGGGCGLAWVNDKAATTDTSATGFSIVNVDVAGSNFCDMTLSAVHETGHNFGMRHDKPNDSGNSAVPYNFGHVGLKARERTLLAYNTQCEAGGFSCVRRDIFSSPDAQYSNGDTAGSATENNREMLCRTAQSIAKNLKPY